MDLGEGDAWRGSGKSLERPQGCIVKRQKVDGDHLSTLPLQGGWAGRESQTLEQDTETVLKIIQISRKLTNYPASFSLVWGLILSHDNPMARESCLGKCLGRKTENCLGHKVLWRSPSTKRSLKALRFRWVLKLPKIWMNWIFAAIWPVCVPLAAPVLTACPVSCRHSAERLSKVEKYGYCSCRTLIMVRDKSLLGCLSEQENNLKARARVRNATGGTQERLLSTHHPLFKSRTGCPSVPVQWAW